MLGALRRGRFLAGCAVCLFWIGCSTIARAATLTAAVESVQASQLREYVDALSSDIFEGREAGSRGGYAAGNYLGQHFRRLNLSGAGDNHGYYQAFSGQSRNLLGSWEGSDPKLRDQIVLVSAHYDHVGYGSSRNSYGPFGFIHNGADDNASGDAGLLELAEALVQIEPRSKRTIVFAFWDGEEGGLLGSKHWVANPTFPRDRVVCMINLDMIGRLRDERLWIYGSRTRHGLRHLVADENRQSDLVLDFDWTMKPDSDHHSFWEANIPAMMFHTGLHSDYHRPSDDAEKINVTGMERVVRLLVGVVHSLANEEREPTKFRSVARSENQAHKALLEAALPPLPSRLGIGWQPSPVGEGVGIVSVEPGSPAAAAGLYAGDRITAFDGVAVDAKSDVASMIQMAAPQIRLTIERAGSVKPLEFPVVLRGGGYRVGLAWRRDEGEPGSVIVARVIPGTPADRAGIQPGDRIYRVLGRPFQNEAEFERLVQGATDSLDLLIERFGREQEVAIPLPNRAQAAK